jgi:putative hydrolase of the HAD superfamily
MSTVKGLLFDLDGTLFDRESCVRELVVAQQQAFQRELAGIAPELYCTRVLTLDAHGYGKKDAVYRKIVEEFALPEALGPRLIADFWQRYDGASQLFEDVLPALTAFHSAGLRLAIITNGATARQQSKVDRLGIGELFQAVQISERESVRKPEREAFERTLRKLGLQASEAWHIGDHPELDVAAAAAVGVAPVWRRTDYWPTPSVPHRVIDRLDELQALL